MQFSRLAAILLVSLMSSGTLAAPAPEDNAHVAEPKLAAIDTNLKRDVGCPSAPKQCDHHCRSMGKAFGYCDDFKFQ
ncbi:hypothetical protein McanMca71_001492 [Microsporum canis]